MRTTEQFLRDNIDVPLFRNVQPQDIEEVTDRFIPFWGTEFFGDSIKRIRTKDTSRESEVSEENVIYVISLIEHKSKVDYNVTMQLLKYMVRIWHNYELEMEKCNISRTNKSFQYPLILPIVYYEGAAKWTADMHFSSRIMMNQFFQEYIPDFTYKIIQVQDYSNEELLHREDAMSVIMLFNKIQTAEDLTNFLECHKERISPVMRQATGRVLELLVSTIYSVCRRLKMSEETILNVIEEVKEGEMGYLFENMEDMDIQKERAKTEEQRKKTEEQRKKTEEERKKTEAEKINKYKAIISVCQKFGATKENTVSMMMEECNLQREEAEKILNKYWIC